MEKEIKKFDILTLIETKAAEHRMGDILTPLDNALYKLYLPWKNRFVAEYGYYASKSMGLYISRYLYFLYIMTTLSLRDGGYAKSRGSGWVAL